MTKAMYVHHIINIVLMIALIVFNNTDVGGLTLSIILGIVFITNIALLKSEKPSSALNDGETKNSLLNPDESKYSKVPNRNKVTKNQQEEKIELPSTGVKGNLNSTLVATVLLSIGSLFLFKGICSILIRKVN